MEKQSTKSPEKSLPPVSSRTCLTVLPPDFYQQSSAVVARSLLGKLIVRQIGTTTLVARIVETEAYEGDTDPASHAFRGKTERNRAMFEAGGIAYVYLSYGMHHCLNVVTGKQDDAQAVLLRAAEPLGEFAPFYLHRRISTDCPEHRLLSGPGKLCQGLQVGLEMNFHPFTKPPLQIREDSDGTVLDSEIVATPRIGITKAKDAPLRFCLKRSIHLSRRLAPSVS